MSLPADPQELLARISVLECQLHVARSKFRALSSSLSCTAPNLGPTTNGLSLHENKRYGRQMILDDFGLSSQLRLKSASVLVVGAGGLGCPALNYLSAAGVGHIGIMDHDVVELSNLQRQILHSDSKIGWNKAKSAEAAVRSINPNIDVVTYPISIAPSNVESILQRRHDAGIESSSPLPEGPYDIVLDCTDNPPTRYLLADATSKFQIPLVSGAALRYDGQLAVFNFGKQAPCYRCVFPKPPKPETLGSCAEEGVLGVVTGVIGTLQALETIKILTGLNDKETFIPTLTLFSALSPSLPFRTVKLRTKSPSCITCGIESSLKIDDMDYVAFCGGTKESEDGTESKDSRISPKVLSEQINGLNDLMIIDVRSPIEFGICSIPGSTNKPLKDLLTKPAHSFDSTLTRWSDEQAEQNEEKRDLVLVCRRGNDSQVAAQVIRSAVAEQGMDLRVTDLIGGLVKWAEDVDPLFPVY